MTGSVRGRAIVSWLQGEYLDGRTATFRRLAAFGIVPVRKSSYLDVAPLCDLPCERAP
ncbi:hypothetical protein AM571_PC01106 (plasmid) [Rhizobium etli 8C-3]|uniref:Uncharacterized protein n=1 Tax=Rhizobium etli 8C-3 TaxID=538025 RepID=A0A1L5PF85_RHIET|nr:hypothetical protein AM571_PC01106 [Rhizobium etli 8C-3]